MDDPIKISRPYSIKYKRNIVVAIFVIQAITDVASWIAGPYFETPYNIIAFLGGFGILVAVLIWCHTDAAERNIKVGMGFRIAMISLMPVALIYYLVKSRGWRRGLISVLKVIGLYALLLIFSTILNLCLALFEDRMGFFR